jgi:thiol:disulfide interchange protein
MSRCNKLFRRVGLTITLFIVLAPAYLSALACPAGENPAQNNGATWVLHKAHSELAGDYDPRRDPEKDLAAASEEARRFNKNILVVVGGEWCSWCHTMDRFFHDHPNLEALRDNNYVFMKVNMSQENQNRAFLSRFPRIRGYPHIFVLADSGALIRSQTSNELEDGKSYNEELFKKFLEHFGPKTRQ